MTVGPGCTKYGQSHEATRSVRTSLARGGKRKITNSLHSYAQRSKLLIHSARPIVTPVANIVFCCFVFLDLKSGDGRTDNMCEHNDPYRPWLWIGRVDQFQVKTVNATGWTVGLTERIIDDTCLVLFTFNTPPLFSV